MPTEVVKYRIRTLYATAAVLATANPVLLEGEPATESDTGVKKIGDGVTAYNDLPAESGGGGGSGSGDVVGPASSVDGRAVVFSGTTGKLIRQAGAAPVLEGDARLTDARTPTAHNQAASTISDSTTAGRALLTAADAPAQRTALGLGTAATTASADYAPAAQGVTGGNSHDHNGGDGAQIAYSSLSGLPTLGSLAALSALGSITSAGAIGSTANLPVITTTGGALSVGAFGTGANQFCQGNDSRLSDARTPTAHTHGNITNVGAIGSTANLPVITGTAGALQVGSFGSTANTFAQGNDSRFHDSVTLGASVSPVFNLTGQALGAVDHGADRLLFWDDSAGTLAPLTLGTNLTITGTTLDATGGGGPGGSTTQVQYNNAGALAGAVNVEIKADNLQLTAPGSAPGAADADSLIIYPVGAANRFMAAMRGPLGSAVLLQPSLFSTNVVTFFPQSGTVGTGSNAFQTAWTSNGTVTHAAVSATSKATACRRTNYANVATTTNQQLGPRMNTSAERVFFRGNVAGTGGFFYFNRFRINWPAATCRLFSGLQGVTDTTSICTSDAPSGPYCGLQHLTTDPATGSGAFSFVTHDGTTRNALAINITPNIVSDVILWDFMMYCEPNGGTIFFALDDLTNGVRYSNSTTSNLPGATVMMSPQSQGSNGTANTTVGTVAHAVGKIYVEAEL